MRRINFDALLGFVLLVAGVWTTLAAIGEINRTAEKLLLGLVMFAAGSGLVWYAAGDTVDRALSEAVDRERSRYTR